MKEWTPAEIREFRLSLGLSQRVFCRVIGVTPTYSSLIETGDKRPGPVLRRLLDCLEAQQGTKKKGGKCERSL